VLVARAFNRAYRLKLSGVAASSQPAVISAANCVLCRLPPSDPRPAPPQPTQRFYFLMLATPTGAGENNGIDHHKNWLAD
jgi:hypothetical protein